MLRINCTSYYQKYKTASKRSYGSYSKYENKENKLPDLSTNGASRFYYIHKFIISRRQRGSPLAGKARKLSHLSRTSFILILNFSRPPPATREALPVLLLSLMLWKTRFLVSLTFILHKWYFYEYYISNLILCWY